jgi:hypothetical protein
VRPLIYDCSLFPDQLFFVLEPATQVVTSLLVMNPWATSAVLAASAVASFAAGLLTGLWRYHTNLPGAGQPRNNAPLGVRPVNIWVGDSNLTFKSPGMGLKLGRQVCRCLDHLMGWMPLNIQDAVRPCSTIDILLAAKPDQTLLIPTDSLNLSWQACATLEHIVRLTATLSIPTQVVILAGQNDCDQHSRSTRPSVERDERFSHKIKGWLCYYEDLQNRYPHLTLTILMPFDSPTGNFTPSYIEAVDLLKAEFTACALSTVDTPQFEGKLFEGDKYHLRAQGRSDLAEFLLTF